MRCTEHRNLPLNLTRFKFDSQAQPLPSAAVKSADLSNIEQMSIKRVLSHGSPIPDDG